MLRYVHQLIGLTGIPANPSLPGNNFKHPKFTELHPLAVNQRVEHRVQSNLNGEQCVLQLYVGLISDNLRQPAFGERVSIRQGCLDLP